MDFDVLDSLDDLGYNALEKDCDRKAMIEEGPKSLAFTQLVEWISKELQGLRKMDSYVNAITDPEDSSSFLLEVSTFLKELQCPHKSLVTGPISQRLLDVKSRLVLLDYLCTELQAARICHQKSQIAVPLGKRDSIVANQLNSISEVLQTKLVSDGSHVMLLSQVEEKVKQHLSSHPELVPQPAIQEVLAEEQWKELDTLYHGMLHDYSVRREMLLTRLDVTIQSFKWGEGSKGKEDEIFNAYSNKRNTLKKSPSVELPNLLSAREDVLVIEKTSNDELVKNTKSSLNRILINAVPDRGGRPGEQRPAKEMPTWSKRSAGRGGGRGDYRGGGNRQQKHFQKNKEKSQNQGPFDAAGKY